MTAHGRRQRSPKWLCMTYHCGASAEDGEWVDQFDWISLSEAKRSGADVVYRFRPAASPRRVKIPDRLDVLEPWYFRKPRRWIRKKLSRSERGRILSWLREDGCRDRSSGPFSYRGFETFPRTLFAWI